MRRYFHLVALQRSGLWTFSTYKPSCTNSGKHALGHACMRRQPAQSHRRVQRQKRRKKQNCRRLLADGPCTVAVMYATSAAWNPHGHIVPPRAWRVSFSWGDAFSWCNPIPPGRSIKAPNKVYIYMIFPQQLASVTLLSFRNKGAM